MVVTDSVKFIGCVFDEYWHPHPTPGKYFVGMVVELPDGTWVTRYFAEADRLKLHPRGGLAMNDYDRFRKIIGQYTAVDWTPDE
jgi:hypothetical protein